MTTKKKTQTKTRRWMRWILGISAFIVLAVLARPTIHLIRTAWQDVDARLPTPQGFIDDASRMNSTPVAQIWPVPANTADAEQQLVRLLQRAREEGLRVSIAGAKHSMGGHTMYPGGIVIDMLPFNDMQLDEKNNILHVQAGAIWKDIIAFLDPRDLSVAVMQSNNSFSVGGSISVNCHGWQYNRPPIASTVQAFRLMQADGTIVTCSRTKNSELFSLVLGGYGLFGIILDVELSVVPNERYHIEQILVPVDQAMTTYENKIKPQSDVAMVYARMGIVPDEFLEKVIINVLYRDPAADGKLPKLSEPGLVKLRRSMFRGSAGSDYGKQLRWAAETKLQPHLRNKYFSRNQMLNEGVEIYENRSAGSTDILHEYFVPRESVEQFVIELQRIIPEHDADLLNVTVRFISTDHDSFLRYADQEMFSFVMLFNQPRSDAGDQQMELMTRALIESALQLGGRYYLPYRLHATVEQFNRAYPQAKEFFAKKKQYDPEGLFQNRFYLKYGPGEPVAD